jgi:hypothetical protein
MVRYMENIKSILWELYSVFVEGSVPGKSVIFGAEEFLI